MRLVLVRHGETDFNRQRRIQGRSDLELNERGRKQAERLAQALKSERVEAIYTSPLRRAFETAQLIAHFHHLEVATLDGLMELDAGEVDGLTYDEMATRHGDFLEKWTSDCTSVRPPGGCTLHELQDQTWGAIQEITRRHQRPTGEGEVTQGATVIAVAHFFPILSVACKVLGLDLSECRRLRLDLASITTLDFNPSRTVLASWNDTCHLKAESP